MKYLTLAEIKDESNIEKTSFSSIGNASNQDFSAKTFRGCEFVGIEFERASFAQTIFIGCNFLRSSFSDSTTFENASFDHCSFVRSEFDDDTDLSRVRFQDSKFSRCEFGNCKGSSFFTKLSLDRKSRISGVVVDRTYCDIESFKLLQRNVRRTRWIEWYREHPIQACGLKFFWFLSDYGTSTQRLLSTFVLSTIAFQQAYLMPWYFGGEPLIKQVCFPEQGALLTQVRALYFSIVTSTVGFSDIVPIKTSLLSHSIVLLQVLFAYILLGAILARVSSMLQE